jgi:predicted nucleotide-binding protein (sugar kinase/HSP70/actin superfamily)
LRVGIPRVLNMYAYAPLFNAYLESLGLAAENIVYSDYTSPGAVSRGRQSRRHRPLLPLEDRHRARLQPHHQSTCKKPLDVIFFPMSTFSTLLSSRSAPARMPAPP